MSGATTVALIDDHQTLLDLLTFAISAEDDIVVVGTATTGGEGLLLVERTCPDVVLLDVVLPDGDGVAVAAALIQRHPAARVVMLTASEDIELVGRAAGAGACGVVAKSGALGQVLEAIRSARSGAMIVDPTYLAQLHVPRRPTPPVLAEALDRPVLSPREQQVLELLGRGKDPRTISRELSISLHTCRGYVKATLAKLDCHSQLEAVVKARRLGLLAATQWAEPQQYRPIPAGRSA
jgi:DNA-binding NarL/FixJ family response regulator